MIEGLVSIIMPSYNAARFIGESINSVLLQTYSNWELLIVDDCSKDNSVEVVRKFANIDKRVVLFSLEKNVGAAAARNVAIEHAQGQYIAFLDSDDVWDEYKLEKQLAFMKQYSYAFTFSNYYIMEENGKKTENIVKVPSSLSYHQYLRNTIIGCLTVIIDRQQTGDFKMPLIKSSHDMALWLLIMKRGFKAYGLKDVLAGYRLVSTSNTAKKWKAAKDVWKVYREIEGLSVLYAAYCFCGYAINAVLKRI
ncbi:glycosyltransferase family 2 protein [Bacteroides uniformis]|jgi:teichuronic acid biosynthesis glycosyltransferase TuaG|uniref:glycosyltransferase family 2 protein n=1 Tax=Bacteroides uniformis TaxID=820 RepID=UPI00232D7F50|nr:glycosyltransferase family 2 protein [Bacteroides uniformis]MDC1820859.1 glycosyltransferase family 2 protein [Bacteroides uniformis]